MPPSKFQIYVDESLRQGPGDNDTEMPSQTPLQHQSQQQQQHHHQQDVFEQQKMPPKGLSGNKSRFIMDLNPTQKFSFDWKKLYPETGGEFSFEELHLVNWRKGQEQSVLRKRIIDLERENNQLKEKVEMQEDTINYLQKQIASQNPTPTNSQPLCYPLQHNNPHHNQQQQQPQQHHLPQSRLSIVPQSLQPAGVELYGAQVEFPTVVHDWETSIATRNIMPHEVTRNQTTLVHDKFTVPINNSQYIKENLITSTPSSKDDESRRPHNFNRRKSRPSIGGSPTLKLSPITETSRECNSKSSSSTSSSAMTTVKKATLKPAAEEDSICEKQPAIDYNHFLAYRQVAVELIDEIECALQDMEEAAEQTIQTADADVQEKAKEEGVEKRDEDDEMEYPDE